MIALLATLALAAPPSIGCLTATTAATSTSTVLLTMAERDLLRLEQVATFEAKKCLASLKRCNGDLADLRRAEPKIEQALVEQSAAESEEKTQPIGLPLWLAIGAATLALVGGVVVGFELRGRAP